jgi:hypothetical protein
VHEIAAARVRPRQSPREEAAPPGAPAARRRIGEPALRWVITRRRKIGSNRTIGEDSAALSPRRERFFRAAK